MGLIAWCLYMKNLTRNLTLLPKFLVYRVTQTLLCLNLLRICYVLAVKEKKLKDFQLKRLVLSLDMNWLS